MWWVYFKESISALTCFHSTGRSSSVHIHTCSHVRNWVCARRWRRVRKGWAGKRPYTLYRSTLRERQRARSDVKELKRSSSRVCGSASYPGHRRRSGRSSRRCSGCSRGTWWSHMGRPRRSRLPRGSSNPGPCSRWPRWSTSHPYGHPGEEELLKKSTTDSKLSQANTHIYLYAANKSFADMVVCCRQASNIKGLKFQSRQIIADLDWLLLKIQT